MDKLLLYDNELHQLEFMVSFKKKITLMVLLVLLWQW
jgi:hypothetical protein